MKNKLRLMSVLFATSILLTAGCSSKDTATDPETPPAPTYPVWKSDPSMASSLAPNLTKLAGYTIDLPGGYQEDAMPPEVAQLMSVMISGGGIKLFHNPGGNNPVGDNIQVFQLPMPPQDKPAEDLLTVGYAMFAGQLEKEWQNPTFSDPETGMINGKVFMRCYCKGTYLNGPKPLKNCHGFSYVTVDGSTVFAINCVDSEPYSYSSMSLLEASVLTLKPS